MASNWLSKPWMSKLQRLVLRVMGVCEHGAESCCQNQQLDSLPPISVAMVESADAEFAGMQTTSNVYMHASSGMRTVSYWSRGGHFYRWQYTPELRQDMHRHIGRMAADPCIELTWDDAAEVHEKMRFLELTWDSQDVVGW